MVEFDCGQKRKAAFGGSTISCRAGSRGSICFWSRARPGPARPRSRSSSCWRAPGPARNASTSRCPKPSANCAHGAASHGWTLDERHRGVRIAAAGKPARFRAAAEPALFVRSRTRRDHQADFRGRRSRRSRTGWCSTAFPRSGCWRRARCATGGRFWRSSITSRKFSATVLLLDDLTAEARRQDRAQRRAWRVAARGTGAGLWRGAAARACRQVSRRQVSRRLPRRHHHDRRPQRVSAAGGLGISHEFTRSTRCRAASPNSTSLLGGGVETGSSTLILGPAGTGKSLARHHVCRRRDRAGREGGLVRVRRRTRPAVLAHERSRYRSRGNAAQRQSLYRTGRCRRTVARRIRPSRPQAGR